MARIAAAVRTRDVDGVVHSGLVPIVDAAARVIVGDLTRLF
jgi:hypothetical protein